MANDKKKVGRPFQPGQSGNPNGRPPLPDDLKMMRGPNRHEYGSALGRLSRMTYDELEKIIKLKQGGIVELSAAKFLLDSFIHSDPRRLEFVLEYIMGKPQPSDHPYSTTVIEDLPLAPVSSEPAVKSFDQFCLDAGYFKPFSKQHEMMAFTIHESQARLLLGARGYGKTDYCTIMGIAYDLYLAWKAGKDMSEHTNLIITKSKSRNSAIVVEIANALSKNGVPMSKSNASVIRVEGLIGQDHSVEAITIKSSMRGRHPKRIVMDDPVTDEDTSEAMRNTVKKRYDEAYKLCKNIIIIGQPAHQHDLYAKLRGVIKTMLVPHGTIPDLDADLEAMKLAQVDQNSIEMSYHLRVPVQGTQAFADIKYLDKFPTGDSVAFIDPSDGGDYTALSIVKGYMEGVAVIGFEWKMAWFHCLEEMVPILKARGVRKLCFETNHSGTQPIDQLRSRLKELKIGVVGKHSDSNKHAVIMSAGTFAHQIFLSRESGKTYTDHVVEYEYGAKFDDAPDSLARCLEWIGLIRGKK